MFILFPNRISSGRMEYMETQPGGLADAGSFRTHVKAAGDGLIGMNSAYTNRDRERDGEFIPP